MYNRFDSHDLSIECESLLAARPLPVPGDIDISTVGVTNQLKKSKANKAPGPDGNPGRLLRVCAIELGPVFQPLFKQSVDIDLCDSYHLENVYSGTGPKNVITVRVKPLQTCGPNVHRHEVF